MSENVINNDDLNEEDKKETLEQKMSSDWGLRLIMLVIVASLLGGVIAINKATQSNSSISSSYEKNEHAAYSAAKRLVSSKLKNPSTAKFPSYYSGEMSMTRSGSTWTVKGWVDAENGFGGVVRNNFTATFKLDTKDYTYSDGEVSFY